MKKSVFILFATLSALSTTAAFAGGVATQLASCIVMTPSKDAPVAVEVYAIDEKSGMIMVDTGTDLGKMVGMASLRAKNDGASLVAVSKGSALGMTVTLTQGVGAAGTLSETVPSGTAAKTLNLKCLAKW